MTDAEDLPFRHYSLGHRLIAWTSRNLFDHFNYTVRHGLIRGMKRHGGLGWTPEWAAPTKEQVFWRNLPLEGRVVYDIGAYHGILSLFFASRARRVVAYEPNDENHARLVENIRLNRFDNVQVRKLAIGARAQRSVLTYSSSMAGGGRIGGKVGNRSEFVEVTTLDNDIAAHSLPAPDLIKIDIEGLELEALRGACRTLAAHRPDLFLEMHGETMREKKRNSAAITAFLREAGYTDILHVESGALITPANTPAAAEGHLYCRYTAGRSTPCPTSI